MIGLSGIRSSVVVAAVLSVLAACTAVCNVHAGDRSNVSSDELVVFFPTDGGLAADGASWTVPVHGWIFEPEQSDFIRNAVINRLAGPLNLIAESNIAIAKERVRHFLVDNERAKTIVVRVGEETFVLEPSERDGHFRGEISLPQAAARRLMREGGWIDFEAVLRKSDDRMFTGSFRLVAPDGLLVISDIDDTVKITEVTERVKLIENTFFREFRAVDGMADVYQKWNGQGAAFAFVSSSPWQLYLPLSDFLAKSGFPAASYYLKPFSFKDPSVANVLSEPDEHKLKAIRELLARHPSRRVVLVGDSGERDPEIYGQVARENPEQVARILIRRVATDETNDARFEKAFESVPAAIWSVFDNADELPAHID